MLLSNRVAVITGGARGIGRAIALKFAEHGCTPVIVDIRQNEAMETLRLVSERKGGTRNSPFCLALDGYPVKGLLSRAAVLLKTRVFVGHLGRTKSRLLRAGRAGIASGALGPLTGCHGEGQGEGQSRNEMFHHGAHKATFVPRRITVRTARPARRTEDSDEAFENIQSRAQGP